MDKDCIETVKWQVMKVPFEAQGFCRVAACLSSAGEDREDDEWW